mmetsp:Transcript_45085/g.78715  ORF Transcript_45085/g.78715 Transcript_45085/m.78715 type:complete len:260 (-) Transcript_45085:73-852(-)
MKRALRTACRVPTMSNVNFSEFTRVTIRSEPVLMSCKKPELNLLESHSIWWDSRGMHSSCSSSSSRARCTDWESGPTTMMRPVSPVTLIEVTLVSCSICLILAPFLPSARPTNSGSMENSIIMPEAISPCAENRSVWTFCRRVSACFNLACSLKWVSMRPRASCADSRLGASMEIDSTQSGAVGERFREIKLIMVCSFTFSRIVWNCGSDAKEASSGGTCTSSWMFIRGWYRFCWYIGMLFWGTLLGLVSGCGGNCRLA